jgi:FAD/FMN-containing dehydrogenase
MVGNNSSGTTSIRYGVTDKIVSINAILSDGSQVVLGIDFGSIYRKDKRKQLRKFYLQEIIRRALVAATQEEIKRIPKPEIHRRNTGYAVDILLKSDLFSGTEPTINVGKLLVVVRAFFTIEVT